MSAVKVAIIGASGYTGTELVRLVLMHPNIELAAVTSRQHAGHTLGEIFPRFAGIPGSEMTFMQPDADAVAATGAQCALLALPHGVASEFAMAMLDRGLKVVDLSADFRLSDPDVYEEYYGAPHPAPDLLKRGVYGLPEVYAEQIRSADLVASPGCYPTSILLPLLPIVREKLVDPNSIQAFSMSGVSGAGRKESIPLLFAECNDSVRSYGIPRHRHLSEIEQELSTAAGESVTISFLPHLVPLTAGLASTISADFLGDSLDDVTAALENAYSDLPFVRLLGAGGFADTKNVVHTNFLDIGWHLDPRTQRLILTAAEDNLVKGSGGQTIQAFNLMFGFPEETGLVLV